MRQYQFEITPAQPACKKLMEPRPEETNKDTPPIICKNAQLL
jgi:hypothetical protein